MKLASHIGEYFASMVLMICLLVGALAISAAPTIIGDLTKPHPVVTADAA